MKKKKPLWRNVMTTAMVLLTATILATGCSSSAATKPANESSTTSAVSDDSLAKIKEKGKLVVGLNAEFAPYEFHAMVDGKDTVAGFDIDLAREVAKDMGVELELKELSFDALLTTLQSGQVDVIISALSATEERRQAVDFSEPYYHSDQVLLTKKENLDKFNSFEDLKGKKIGIQLSSLQDKLMQTLLPDGNYTKIESMNTLFLSLNSKQIDGIVTSDIVSQMAVASNPDFVIADQVKIDDASLNTLGVAVAMPKQSPSLQAQINDTVKRLDESAQMQKYVEAACELAGASQTKQ